MSENKLTEYIIGVEAHKQFGEKDLNNVEEISFMEGNVYKNVAVNHVKIKSLVGHKIHFHLKLERPKSSTTTFSRLRVLQNQLPEYITNVTRTEVKEILNEKGEKETDEVCLIFDVPLFDSISESENVIAKIKEDLKIPLLNFCTDGNNKAVMKFSEHLKDIPQIEDFLRSTTPSLNEIFYSLALKSRIYLYNGRLTFDGKREILKVNRLESVLQDEVNRLRTDEAFVEMDNKGSVQYAKLVSNCLSDQVKRQFKHQNKEINKDIRKAVLISRTIVNAVKHLNPDVHQDLIKKATDLAPKYLELAEYYEAFLVRDSLLGLTSYLEALKYVPWALESMEEGRYIPIKIKTT